MKFCFLAIYNLALLPCTTRGDVGRPALTRPVRTRARGPLTTLDSPEAPEPSLTPTQELRTAL